MAKLKHRVQVAEEERDIAVEKERETKLRVTCTELQKDYSCFSMKENFQIAIKH